MSPESITNEIINFLDEIGIEVIRQNLEVETFLPGILIERGKILVDETKLLFPGDLLHEAGHLAVAPGEIRFALSGEVTIPGADMNQFEAYATAWAYAAIVYLELEPKILFHADGYHGKSEQLIFTFAAGCYPGANGLEAAGMIVTGETARDSGIAPYPNMLKWLRD